MNDAAAQLAAFHRTQRAAYVCGPELDDGAAPVKIAVAGWQQIDPANEQPPSCAAKSKPEKCAPFPVWILPIQQSLHRLTLRRCAADEAVTGVGRERDAWR